MSLPDTEAALARQLAAARRDGHTVQLPGNGFDQVTAYAIQEAVYEILGTKSSGWKVGSTSKEAQRKLGTDEPGAGRLLRQWCFSNGDSIPVFFSHDVQVEVEFAFRLAVRLPSRTEPYDRHDVSNAIATVMPGIEIVGSRFNTGLAGSGQAAVTADGGANIAFASGPETSWVESPDLPKHECSLLINGTERARGNGARALDDPMNVLVWLANHLSRRGIDVPADSIVTTGTCTGLVAIGPGDEVCGDFGELGSVTARIVEAI